MESPIHTLFQVSTSRLLVAGEYSGTAASAVLLELALGGALGVRSMFEVLRDELQLTMKLAGPARLSDITRKFVI